MRRVVFAAVVFCFSGGVLSGACAQTLAQVQAVRAVPARVVPQPPRIGQLPAEASEHFALLDAFLPALHLAPLRTYSVPAGDVEVRVWRGFSYVKMIGFILRRHKGIWSGEYVLEPRPELQACDFQMPVSRTNAEWEALWQTLKKNDILTLPDQKQLDADPKQTIPNDSTTLDGMEYLIETNQNGVYRGYLYGEPSRVPRKEDRQVATIVKGIQKAFWDSISVHQFEAEGVAGLPPDVERHLLHDRFVESQEAVAVPDWVKQAFVSEFPDYDFILVNPNEPMPAPEPGAGHLPRHRLMFYAVAGDYCVVSCEYIAKTHSNKVLLFHKASKPKPFVADVYQALLGSAPLPKNLREVRALQKKTKFLRVYDRSF